MQWTRRRKKLFFSSFVLPSSSSAEAWIIHQCLNLENYSVLKYFIKVSYSKNEAKGAIVILARKLKSKIFSQLQTIIWIKSLNFLPKNLEFHKSSKLNFFEPFSNMMDTANAKHVRIRIHNTFSALVLRWKNKEG